MVTGSSNPVINGGGIAGNHDNSVQFQFGDYWTILNFGAKNSKWLPEVEIRSTAIVISLAIMIIVYSFSLENIARF